MNAQTLPVDENGAVDLTEIEAQRRADAHKKGLGIRAMRARPEREPPADATFEVTLNQPRGTYTLLGPNGGAPVVIRPGEWSPITADEFERLCDSEGVAHEWSDSDGTKVLRPKRKFRFRDRETEEEIELPDLPERVISRGGHDQA